MRVFITGGTGFVGEGIVAELQRRDHEVVALVRREGTLPCTHRVRGDASDAASIPIDRLAGCEAAIHLVGIIREQPRRGVTFHRLHVEATANVLDLCRRAGIRRCLHMSALGARHDSNAQYHRTKAQAEDLVRSSGLDWTIFRPAIILGRQGGFLQLVQSMARRRIVPLIGDGRQPVSPVSRRTVAQAFANALENPAAVGKTYELGGDTVTLRELYQRVAARLGVRITFVGMPVALLRALAAALDRFTAFPLTREQITMLGENRPPEDNSVYEELGLEYETLEGMLGRMVASE